MTKTKVESNPGSNARSSYHGQDGQDKDYGDGSSHQQSGQIHRHDVQQMTSKQPLKNNSTQSKTKEIHYAKSKRGSSSTNIRRATNGANKDMKPESIKCSEKTHQSTRRRNRSKSSGRRKLSDASITSDVSKDSGKLSFTDSSSEISDSSEDHKRSTDAQCGEPEVSYRGTDDGRMDDSAEQISDDVVNATLSPGLGFGEGSISPGDQRSYASLDSRLNLSASVAFSDLTGDFADGVHEDLMREIDDLRSENEYLKDEMEELRSEMLEMRDIYMEEDVYQLQELRQQLEQANKACRILQYRLRKSERRSLRVAKTGHVDGELIRTLEHDIRVAKSVSLRLHGELEAIQKKKSQLEWENEELRERLQSLEVAKQVLQTEMDRSRENSLKRRSLRSTSSRTDKKLSLQDDSADLKCQLHFAKEESALMCKKLTKMAMESEVMREQLAKYRVLYGDVDESKAAAGTVNSTHTREAEVKVHLRLVEEEATLLSRRIVELEVENRGLRAEMSELREKGGTGLEEEELMKVTGEGLALAVCTDEQEEMVKGLEGEEKEDNAAIHVDIQTNSEEQRMENSFTSHMLREGPVGGEQEMSDETTVEAQSQCKSDCTLGVKDLKGLLAIHDQALLVRSTIQFLTSPAKNGLSAACTPYLSKTEVDPKCETHQWLLDPMLSPLTNGLEVLQAQLHALVEKFETLLNSTSEGLEADLEKTALNCAAEKNNTKDQAGYEHLGDGEHVYPRIPNSNGCDQDSIVLLTLQLKWFIQQWKRGEKPAGDGKNVFEMYCPNDLCLLMDTESKEGKNKPQEKCNSQVSSDMLSDLRAVLQDLFDELLEEHKGAQHVVRKFANAKAAWAVEHAELKSLISRLEGSAGKEEAVGPLDPNVALQKDHIEKLQHLLAESYAAVLDLTKRLEVYERNWSSERQELMQHLNHMRLECEGSKTSKQNRKMQSAERTKMEVDGNMQRKFLKTSTPKSNKNWKYLSQEAALLDQQDPCKTWDCPIMPPSFPGLNLTQDSIQRSHTAPERTSIRIYYSPPSTKRIHMRSAMAAREEKCENSQEPHFSAVSCGLVNRDWVTAYETLLGSLPFDCQSLVERDSINIISSPSSSALQNCSIGSHSRLAFNNLNVSANLSDDMKEITASVLQTSQSSSLEWKRARDSGSSVVSVVSTGTQTQRQPEVSNVGLQTDGPRSLCATKHWSPRVTSFVSARTQQVSNSLERVSGPIERFQSHTNSPKIPRRHSASSPLSSKSSSSSFSTSSLSSSSSLSTSSRLEYRSKENGLWNVPQRGCPGSAWSRSATCRPSSASAPLGNKPGGRTNAGIPKYGLVQEFLRNVCGRGEKTNPEEDKAPAARRDHVGLVGTKKSEQPPSRIPAVPLVRNDSITKIINRRFMKQGQKEDLTCSQSKSNKGSDSKNKGLEDGACDCTSRSLTSCFTRHSHKNPRHARGQNKPRPQENVPAGGKGDPLA
nr:protein SOGA1 [Misgurnus anguillicaudatus]